MTIIINRKWSMASAETFTITPITELISRYVKSDLLEQKGDWIDPFARNSVFKKDCKYTNDLNPAFKCTHNMDALDFLKLWPDCTFDGVLFDPPFSPRQAKEEYQGFGAICPNTSCSFWTDRKNEAANSLYRDQIAKLKSELEQVKAERNKAIGLLEEICDAADKSDYESYALEACEDFSPFKVLHEAEEMVANLKLELFLTTQARPAEEA